MVKERKVVAGRRLICVTEYVKFEVSQRKTLFDKFRITVTS